MTGGRPTIRLAACAALAGLLALPGHGEQMRSAVSTPPEVQAGEAKGIAVTSLGRLSLAPRVTPWGAALPADFPSHVLAAAADDAGNVFLATGPDGAVVKIARGGQPSVLFRTDEPLVTAILLLPGGELLAASAPGGKLYKVRSDGTGSLWCETEERYVWALATGKDGAVLAATGDRGRLLSIDRNGHTRVLFDSDETHLVSLAKAGDGGVWAGGSARGLVYRIDPEGHVFVLYDDDLPEARSIVATKSGDLIVAFDAPPVSEKRPPALRLRVAGGATSANEAMTDLDARQTPALQGVIEGLSSGEAEETGSLRGKIVRLSPEGAAVELWRSRTDAPFALALDDRERAVFATGEPAKLWRVEGVDETALIATLDEAQATAFANAGGTLVAATSNPAATYRMEHGRSDEGTYLARPVDAGSVARWGTLTWRRFGSGGHVELYTRTGNCEDPDGTWSAWSPAQTDAAGTAIPNPEGRFLQWRARVSGSSDDGPGLSTVAASYATRNRQPALRDLRVEPASGFVSGKATIRWSVADPDGDGISVEVQARPAGSQAWRSAARSDPAPLKPTDPTLGNDGSSREGKATWDTATWDEGAYEVRAVASDQPGNAPAEALEDKADLVESVRLDRTPPAIEAKRTGATIEAVVTDALSPILRLEVVVDGRVEFSPRPVDGVSDGVRETFRFPAKLVTGSGAWTLRATDAAGNAVETPVPSP